MQFVLPGLEGYFEVIVSPIILILLFLPAILTIIGMFLLFQKAGVGGWKAIIPIYSTYVWFKLIYGKGLKMLLLCVPFLNALVYTAIRMRTAQCFNKDIEWSAGLLLCFPVVLPLMMLLGKPDYLGPVYKFI